VKRSDASGSRLDEACGINRSLSALGNVIAALTGAETAAERAGHGAPSQMLPPTAPRHTTQLSPRCLNHTASYGVASNTCRSLARGASTLNPSGAAVPAVTAGGTTAGAAAAAAAAAHVPYRDSKLTRVLQEVGPGRYYSSRHSMSFRSRDEGSKCVE
jgi:hypothetical protein